MTDHILKATAGCYAGTENIVERIISESKRDFAWRPARAGILYAMAGLNKEVWMTAEEMTAWADEAPKLAKSRHAMALRTGEITGPFERVKPYDILGVTASTLRGYKKGTHIPKHIALACAFYALGRPLPVLPGDSAALDAWFRPRFGSARSVTDWLGISDAQLAERLRGYRQMGEERLDRAPEAAWVMALAWIYYVGPVCPYGLAPIPELWTGQMAAGGVG